MIETSTFRDQVLDAAKRFKSNWIDLARLLYTVKKDKLFKEWGYISLDTYCTKEIGIRKQTAFKLLSSYYFLTREEPQILEDPKNLPNYEAINILRRARERKGLKEADYNNLKELVLEKASEPREVGKQYRSMLWSAKSVDPEEERKTRGTTIIKRLLSTLKTLRKEAELLKLLPEKLIRDIDKTIASLDKNLDRQL